MAIIPRADESQVLNAGSPVPLKTGDSGAEIYAKAAGHFSEQIGTLLMKQGGALYAADKAAQKERSKADSENAQTDYIIGLTEMEDRMKRSEEYGTLSTSDMMRKYREESSKLSDSYSAGLTDEFAKSNFDKEAAKITAQRALQFHAGALKDYNSITENKIDSYISKRASIVSSSGTSQELTENIGAVTSRIYNNDVLTIAQKNDKVAAARKELLGAYLNGHISRIMLSNTMQDRDVIAKKALKEIDFVDRSPEGAELNIAGIFNEKEKQKFREDITEAVFKANGRELQRQNSLETMDNRHTKERQKNTFNDLANKGMSVVTDEVTYQIYQEEVRDKAARGLLDPTKVDELEKLALGARGRKEFAEHLTPEETARDNQYREEIYQKAFAVDNPMVLSDDTYNSIKSKKISANASVSINGDLEALSRAFRKDPGLRSRVNSVIQEYDKLKNNPGMKQFPREQQLKAMEAIGKAKMSLYKSVITNPKIDVRATGEDLYQLEVKPVLDSFMPTTKEPVDKKEILNEVKVLNEEYFKMKKEGRLTPEIQKDFAEKLKNLKIKMGSTK